MKPLIIAGPCAIESEIQSLSIAKELIKLNVDYFRGGAFKPRTSPTSFQGLGQEGLEILRKIKQETGLSIVTEVMGVEEINDVAKIADILQIGSRNMQNFDLLKKIAKRAPDSPILLKRALSATKKELLGALEYLTHYGHKAEIFICERGIRTFTNGDYDRFTLDTGLIADLSNDPSFKHQIIVDPSHPAGRSDIVEPLLYAGIAAGADGAIIEVKLDEESQPLCDGEQAITIKKLESMLKVSEKIFNTVN